MDDDLLRDFFYWPECLTIQLNISNSVKDVYTLRPYLKKAPMENIDATYPMELVHMDYLTIGASEGGRDVHILVIADHFT